MKNIITILLLCLCAGAFAQNTDVIVHEYDAYGNRVKWSMKTITLSANKLETILEEPAVESFEFEDNSKISIAPNPTKGVLVVSYTLEEKEMETISCILTADPRGKLIFLIGGILNVKRHRNECILYGLPRSR